MSYSTYNVYKESPLQFYFSKILKLPPTDKVPQAYGSAGKAIHETCEAYILNKNINIEKYFNQKWFYEHTPHTKGTFDNKPLEYEVYRKILFNCINFINTLKGDITPEEKINVYLSEFDNFLFTGYLDFVIRNNGEVFIGDFKSDKKYDYEYHYFQRLTYTWLYWKKHGVIPKKTTWYYGRFDKVQEDSFTIVDIKEFEEQLFKDLRDIESYGTDINKYPIGNYDTLFNAYKSLCLKELERRLEKKLKVVIQLSGAYCKLQGEHIPRELIERLDKELSYEKDGAHFIKQNTGHQYDGVVHLFNVNKMIFLTGLANDVVRIILKYCEEKGLKLEYKIKDIRKETTKVKMSDKLIDMELRDYQEEAVESFMKKKYGIVKAKTGLGKTVIAVECTRKVGLRTLWIINKKILVEQTKEVYEELLGKEIGLITEGKIDIKDITIATYQTLVRNKEKLTPYFRDVGFLINDEVHGAGAKSVKQIARLCTNTKYRLGLSATPNMKTNWLEVKGVTGDICYQMDDNDERNKTFLSDCEIKFFDLNDKIFKPDDNMTYHEQYSFYIANNDIRNLFIRSLIDKHKGQNILIVTRLIEHAESLAEELNIPILIGKTTKEVREKIVSKFKEGNFVCVGSISIISEGWDVPNLDVVIQASAPASPVRTIQTIGRGLRKHPDKEKAYYYDFVDSAGKLFKFASYKRIKYLRNEGHNVDVVKIS